MTGARVRLLAGILLGTLFCGAGALAQDTLAQQVEAAVAASPVARGGFWGIQVVDLASGSTIYEFNPDRFFVPASNTKLFTTALALSRLGADAKFHTRVLADAQPDAAGRVPGAIRLMGGGDPNLSPRTVPYKKGPVTGNPLVVIDDLADQIAAKGVKRIAGDIVGDDTWYVWQPWGDGWTVDDPQTQDGTAASALTVNDNSMILAVRPGSAAGLPAALTTSPAIEYFQIENHVRTVAVGGEQKIHWERVPGSLTLRILGTVPLRGQGEDLELGIDDPALFAAMALRQALQQRGIAVEGRAVARHLWPDELANLKQGQAPKPAAGVELARRESAPLVECLRVVDKVSQNLHAEMMLRAVGRARRNVGSREAGLEELRVFLGDAGVAPEAYHLLDGSGMARLNLVTPATVVRLLRHMWASPERENFLSLLPVGGEDGTLASRFADNSAAGARVHAKTGSLSHVSALSGYIQRQDGSWVAFAVLANNYNGPAAAVRRVMDQICALIME